MIKSLNMKQEGKKPAGELDKIKQAIEKQTGGKVKMVRMGFNPKRMVIWLAVLFLVLPFFVSLMSGPLPLGKVGISELLTDIKEDRVKSIEVEEEKILITYKDKEGVFESRKGAGESFTEILDRSGIDPTTVKWQNKDTTTSRAWQNVMEIFLPVVLTGAIFLFIMRQARGAQDGIFNFGRSRAKIFMKGKQNVTFKDVAGVKEAKQELEEVVDFLKHPKRYRAMGARTPKGVILVGPSGVGKTLLARAIAGEADVPFFSMAGSEFMEMLVGVGASVTGDTPVVVRRNGRAELVEIGKFIDQYYQDGQTDAALPVSGVETLGLRKETNGFWGSRSTKRPVFGGSVWRSVKQVYRHRAKEIFTIEYLGGKLKTTGDHSVFVREHGGIRAKEVRQLKPGDVLVNLPMNTRAWDEKNKTTVHKIKSHQFPAEAQSIWLDVWQDDEQTIANYKFALAQQEQMSQYAIAGQIGVSQATVGNWQREVYQPQVLSKKLVKLNLPDRVRVTPELCKLLGYYTAEGRGTKSLELTFSIDEKDYIAEVAMLMKQVFGLERPVLEPTDSHTIRVIYYSAHLGRFFSGQCGNGSHNKHIPDWLWEMPREYFLAYLEGYSNGDGYVTKTGKLSCTSVSHQLIRELAWFSSMHGIKVGIKHEILPAGRVIKNKPLPQTESWNLIIGATSNPFREIATTQYQFKRCLVKSVKRHKFAGFMYDFCGVNQEAFFGGETPLLLHNSRVRDLFDTAKKKAPAIIFIDEIDAIGRQRSRALTGGHDEREQTLNQILVEMDGFTPNEQLLVIAATNRGDLLDPALIRPGRFDRRVMMDMPDIDDRQEIIKLHSKGKPLEVNIDWQKIAKRTIGFSGADIENMLNEAAIAAARRLRKTIEMKDLEEAALKVKLGPEKKLKQSADDLKMTAYHEAGHAVTTYYLPKMDLVHRISIVSRGGSLGHTLIPPEADRYTETKSHLVAQITSLLGGRTAEKLIFNELTGGAASDISRATEIARTMVVKMGMSGLGPINFGPGTDFSDMGATWYEPEQISETMRSRIDLEVKKIMDECLAKAESLLLKHKDRLNAVTEALLKKETLEAEDFKAIMEQK